MREGWEEESEGVGEGMENVEEAKKELVLDGSDMAVIRGSGRERRKDVEI